ncbi:CCA tRNA nucleotidyltransferase [Candidatus Poribacteria bacterium]|nr:CCA tRNA nucleotidyltransferase [Candidatus Poribacteria bacterium]
MNVASRLERALSPEALEAIHLLGRCGVDAYLVGGPLRDLLLGRPLLDLDISVAGDGVRFARDATRALGGSLEQTHTDFGTASIRLSSGMKLDIATARRETYPAPGSLPVVEPGTLDEDLRRRDFSINALAMRLSPDSFGGVIDLVGGLDDLTAGTVRALHPGSFRDDPTRVFRAVRFEKRFAFRVDPGTEGWIRDVVGSGAMATLTGARVRNELARMLAESRFAACFGRLAEMGVLPLLAEPCADVPVGVVEQRMGAYGGESPSDAALVAWLAGQPEKRSDRIGRWLMLDRSVREDAELARRAREPVAAALAEPTPASAWFDLLGRLSDSALFAVGVAFNEAAHAELAERHRAFRATRPLVTGDDLLAMGYVPGPAFSRVLDAAFRAQIDGELPDGDAARAFVRREMHWISRCLPSSRP